MTTAYEHYTTRQLMEELVKRGIETEADVDLLSPAQMKDALDHDDLLEAGDKNDREHYGDDYEAEMERRLSFEAEMGHLSSAHPL